MDISTYAFLFDMDGVIVDSNPAHKIALKAFCMEHGHELSDDYLEKHIYGRTNKEWIPAVFGTIPYKEARQYAEEKEILYREIFKNDIKPLDGLLDFLNLLETNGIARAIATSAPRSNVDFTLSKTGTEKYFDTILDESSVQRGKPDLEIYLKTAAALGFDPANCVVFEDSLSGVEAGKAAGCKVVALTTTHTADELSGADLVVDNFVGLQPVHLLNTLFGKAKLHA